MSHICCQRTGREVGCTIPRSVRYRKEKELPCFNYVLVIQLLECSPCKSIGMAYFKLWYVIWCVYWWFCCALQIQILLGNRISGSWLWNYIAFRKASKITLGCTTQAKCNLYSDGKFQILIVTDWLQERMTRFLLFLSLKKNSST